MKKNRLDPEKMDRIVAEALSNRQQRQQGYRERALKLFPWICARCGREFEGKRLRELTVHHKETEEQQPSAIDKPFADLKDLLKNKN